MVKNVNEWGDGKPKFNLAGQASSFLAKFVSGVLLVLGLGITVGIIGKIALITIKLLGGW